jgi:hypothetical protein
MKQDSVYAAVPKWEIGGGWDLRWSGSDSSGRKQVLCEGLREGVKICIFDVKKRRGPSRGAFQTSPRNTFNGGQRPVGTMAGGNCRGMCTVRWPLFTSDSQLVDADVSGAGFYAHYRAASVDFAGDMVVALNGTLHEHFVVGFDIA